VEGGRSLLHLHARMGKEGPEMAPEIAAVTSRSDASGINICREGAQGREREDTHTWASLTLSNFFICGSRRGSRQPASQPALARGRHRAYY